MKIHNLIKNPTDLPPVNGRHGESNDVFVIYREIYFDNGAPIFVTSTGVCFYCHEDNEWYNIWDEPQNHISGMFACGGGQLYDRVDDLLDDEMFGYPKEFVDQLTRITSFKCEELTPDVEWVLTKEIVGWFEIPTYEEFLQM